MARSVITLGVPVIDRHEYTANLIRSLRETVRGPFHLVIFDNGSVKRYTERNTPFLGLPMKIVRSEVNRGYYWWLEHLVPSFQPGLTDLFGLVHNDMIFYEEGWDLRVQQAFAADPLLGLVGLCGSWKVDELGGRGDGTVCFFRGEKGQSQDAGERITDLRPALILDSLFMLFRRDVLLQLMTQDRATWDDLPLAHFYDKIWPLRVIEMGYHVGVFGSEIDHIGGVTVADFARFEADAKRWCEEHNIPPTIGDLPDGKMGPCYGLAMYFDAEKRFLGEYRDRKGMIPCWIDETYRVHSGDRLKTSQSSPSVA